MKKVLLMVVASLTCCLMSAQTVEELEAKVEQQAATITELQRKLSFERCCTKLNNFKQDVDISNCNDKEFAMELRQKWDEILINKNYPSQGDKQLLQMNKKLLKATKERKDVLEIEYESILIIIKAFDNVYGLTDVERDYVDKCKKSISASFTIKDTVLDQIQMYIDMLTEFYSEF